MYLCSLCLGERRFVSFDLVQFGLQRQLNRSPFSWNGHAVYIFFGLRATHSVTRARQGRGVYNGEKNFSSFLDELDHLEQFKHVFQKSHYPGGLAVPPPMQQTMNIARAALPLHTSRFPVLFVVQNFAYIETAFFSDVTANPPEVF